MPAPIASQRSIRSMPRPITDRQRTCRSTRYDAALVCMPDEPKFELVRYLPRKRQARAGRKAAVGAGRGRPGDASGVSRRNGAVCYTAYNHRFEPHYVRMRDLIASGALGTIYSCRMFYGNGTARLVRDSPWRDTGAGVLPDLGSHLLDTCRFWFGDIADTFQVIAANRFENRAPDHVVIGTETNRPRLELEMTLLHVAQPFHLRHSRREGQRPHREPVQVGAVHFRAPAARAAKRPSARRDCHVVQEAIRHGRWNTLISASSAARAPPPICVPTSGCTPRCGASPARSHRDHARDRHGRHDASRPRHRERDRVERVYRDLL